MSSASATTGTPAAAAVSAAMGGEQRIIYTCIWGDICSIRPDGTDLRTLVKVPDLGLGGPISPDGRSIAFWVNESGYSGRLWVMAPDGTNQHLVSATLITMYDAPTWSPNSRKLGYTLENDGGMGVVNVDGTGARTVIRGNARQPNWSPDGTWITFTSHRSGNLDVWRVHPDGSGLSDLTNTPAVDDSSPGWSPDGQRLAFVRGNYQPGADLWTMRPDGTDQRVLLTVQGQAVNQTSTSYSPDGTKITFSMHLFFDGFGDDIYTVNADGTNLRQLTHSATFNRAPHWGLVAPAKAPGPPRAVTATVASPILVTKLTGLATYTCIVRAVNLVGTGPASHRSTAVTTPAGLAAAPTGVSVTRAGGKRDVLVSFTPPAVTGGNPISYYKASCVSSTGVGRGSASLASPALVTGLTVGATYRCTVQAANSAGLGPVSTPSAGYTIPR